MTDDIVQNRFLNMARCMTVEDVAEAVRMLAEVSTNPYCSITAELNYAIDNAFDNWMDKEDRSKGK